MCQPDAQVQQPFQASQPAELESGWRFLAGGGVEMAQMTPAERGRKLDQALGGSGGPTGLLPLKGRGLRWELGRRLDLGQVEGLPASELGTEAEVEVFGQRVALPAAGCCDGLTAPHTCRTVKVHEQAISITANMLHYEVAVEGKGLRPGQRGIVRVQITPSRLHEPQARIGDQVGDCLLDKVRGRQEIGIKDDDELAASLLQSCSEGPSLEALAIMAVQELDVETPGLMVGHSGLGEPSCLIGRIVKHLNLKPVLRVVQLSDCVDEAQDYKELVIDGQLDRDQRPGGGVERWGSQVGGHGLAAGVPVTQVKPRQQKRISPVQRHEKGCYKKDDTQQRKPSLPIGQAGSSIPLVRADRKACGAGDARLWASLDTGRALSYNTAAYLLNGGNRVRIPFPAQNAEALAAFLQDLVRIPSLSGQEEAVALRLAAEMRRVGFEQVWTDRMGSVVGRIGPGRGPKLLFNAHMDTVDVGDLSRWSHPPYGGEIADGVLYGRGACDMKGGLAAMVYGVKALLDAGVQLAGDLYVVGVVQEEPCEGLAMRVLVEEEGLRPDFVVLGEPSNLQVKLGHRGRLEMRIRVEGKAAHSSSPDLGQNAVHRAARLIFGLELLTARLASDPFLGQGTLAVTEITSQAASRNAIPECCTFIVDRRLTLGETERKALAEVQNIISTEEIDAKVEVTEYQALSYTGYVGRARNAFPAWVMAEDHPLIQATVRAVRDSLGSRPRVGRWAFSTDGTYTAGEADIPTVGFGPGEERFAHTRDDQVRLNDVVDAVRVYARLAAELIGAR